MSLLAADLRAFVAAARKELRQQRRYPTLFLGQLFWPVMLPAVVGAHGSGLFRK